MTIDWARAVNEWNAVSDEITDAAYEGRWLDWERWRDLLATIPNPKWLRTEPWTDADFQRVKRTMGRAA